jgi:Protein of unknown function (DUF3800)
MVHYDAFRHLCASIFSSKTDLFAMLTAYFDDSGTSDNDPVVAVGGYVASTTMWDTFNSRWRELLLRNGIKRMRRADLENLVGEFADWNPDRRTAFVKKAHAIIKRCTYAPLGVAIVKKDFEDSFPSNSTARKFGFYGWGAHGCVATLGEWCRKYNKREPIHIVFESGTKGQEQVNRTLKILAEQPDTRHLDACRFTWTFADKSILPLQAADVVAYEFYKFIKNEIVDFRKRKVRLSALDLFRDTDLDFLRHFDKEGFENLKKEGMEGWWF